MQEVVIGIVVKDASVLLVQKKNAKGSPIWRFPGGKVEEGESREKALVREVREETSIHCAPIGEIAERNWYSKGLKLIFYVCRYISGDARINEPDTFNHVEWTPPKKAEGLIGHNAKVQIRELLNWLMESELRFKEEFALLNLQYYVQERALVTH